MESLYQLPTDIRPFEDDFYAPQSLHSNYQDLYTGMNLPLDDTSFLSSIPMMFGDVPYEEIEFNTQLPLTDMGWGLDWDSFDPSLTPLHPIDSSSVPLEGHQDFFPSQEPMLEQALQSRQSYNTYNQMPRPCAIDHQRQLDDKDKLPARQSTEADKNAKDNLALESTKPSMKSMKRKKAPEPREETRVIKATKPNILKFQAISTTTGPNLRPHESLLTVFDSFTGPKVKRNCRSGFTDEGKKKVDAVRSIGACLQCKFRKRTCGTGNPCVSCKKRSKGSRLMADLCIRESPFDDLTVTEFYPSSCRKRIVDFHADFSDTAGPRRIITIDGRGRASRPLHIIVLEASTKNLNQHNLEQLQRIANANSPSGGHHLPLPEAVSVLDPDVLSALDLEQWAIEYTHKFNQSQDRFSRMRILRDVYGNRTRTKVDGSASQPQIKIPNATSFLFGLRYVEQELPHSNLVASAVKLVALNYVLSNGIHIISDPLKSKNDENNLPTIKAQLDTKLYQCLHRNEKSLYENLQRLIFKNAGQLARDAVVPVCLCMWLLLRLQCLRASHLMNLRPQNSPQPILSTTKTTAPTTSANHQRHKLNLLISTFAALFRSSMPLLLDFEDPFNSDLLGGNKELIATAKTLGLCIKGFKMRGYIRAWRNSKGYTKAEVARIRQLVIYD